MEKMKMPKAQSMEKMMKQIKKQHQSMMKKNMKGSSAKGMGKKKMM